MLDNMSHASKIIGLRFRRCVCRLDQADHAGAKTGRSPKDKRVVRDPESEADIWWSDGTNGSPNYEMDDR